MTGRRRFCLGMGTQLALVLSGRARAAVSADGSAALPRIACTDWAAAESLALVGNMPIAVPELDVYRQWLPEPGLPAGTADLGARTEPNLEALSALAPDSIFISSWQAGMLPLFRRIAPTEIARLFDAGGDPYLGMRELLLQAGHASGREARARRCLDDFDAQLGALRQALAARPRRPLYVAVLHENGAQAYVYGRGSWVDAVIGRLGLRNAWTAPTTFYGNSLVGIPALAGDPAAAILYLDQGARTRRALAQLRSSTLWRGLPAVAQGRAVMIPSFFALGGIPSAARCARLLAAAMADGAAMGSAR
ncbi:Iron(3+)-hydroxamate-binding protein FhuD precursor [Pigmentiphaga humi]|uniref:Iron(3+)-hydroxamate-binding protein FhuD n=1 Tax=Pigmentiphaga humi TaxID=2478468 RepID=A0A3P4B0X8_9BURK|nr:ABC transporter substrate-binding protein [Pigmentiphaga humi]VCU68785.1 Iron(3+)-hydroxamate-binding protein FhuD precursor [Pigmentiphaga humi]